VHKVLFLHKKQKLASR